MENNNSSEQFIKSRARETSTVYSVAGAVIGIVVAWLIRPSSWGMKPSLLDYFKYMEKSGFSDAMVTEISTMLFIGAVIGFIVGMAFATLINSIKAKS